MGALGEISVKHGRSLDPDARRAVEELRGQLAQPDARLVIIFCASGYDLEALGAALDAAFTCPIMACTTAGEISARGYQSGGLVGASIASRALVAHVDLIEPLCEDAILDAVGALEARCAAEGIEDGARFGLLLIDGLSMTEELIAATLAARLPDTPIIGGSAGDDLRFEATHIYGRGGFAPGRAALCLVETSLPTHPFQTQHFRPTERRFVVTEAEPPRRRVFELDGEPAADVYAEALGLTRDQLTSTVFSQHPLLLRVGGERWVRSVQRVNEDGSLTFYCAIDAGLVLTLGEPEDLIEDLEETLRVLDEALPSTRLIIGCDCIFRRLALVEEGRVADADALLAGRPFIGFSTYGEQFGSLHLNQTLTGIAIGGRA